MMAENYMLKETLSYPSLIREVIAPLRAQAQSVLSDEIIRNIDCIYIYGSGDSLNAAVCAAQSFWEYAGVPAYPLNAMQASRYAAPCLDRTRAARTLTICISNSGETAEMKATVQAIRRNGCKIIGVTGNRSSWLANFADTHLFAGVPEEGGPLNRAPRNSILAEMLVLQALSVVLQERRALTPQEYVLRHPGGALGALREGEK